MGKQSLTDEQQQLRQLTRQAHEAAQDAHAAIRELRAARAEFDQIADDTFAQLVKPRLDEIYDFTSKQFEQIEAAMNACETSVQRSMAEHLGARNFDEMMKVIIIGVTKNLHDLMYRTFKEYAERTGERIVSEGIRSARGLPRVAGVDPFDADIPRTARHDVTRRPLAPVGDQ